MDRFMEQCWIEMQLIEGERPLRESRRPCMAKWESSGCRGHERKGFSSARVFCIITRSRATDLKIHSLQFCVSIKIRRLALKIKSVKNSCKRPDVKS